MAENENKEQNGNEAPPQTASQQAAPQQQPPQQQQAPSGKQRLRELLAIPERQRTDEEWDELNELEISLAQGNREGAPDPQQGNRQKQQGQPGGGKQNPGGQRKRDQFQKGKRPPRRS
jgi:hypothetical protein